MNSQEKSESSRLHNIDINRRRMLVINIRNQWVRSSLLGHDEGDAGAVRLQRCGSVPGPHVEHGQSGQRWSGAAVCSHVPQLVSVPVDGVVVVQLDPAGTDSVLLLCFGQYSAHFCTNTDQA